MSKGKRHAVHRLGHVATRAKVMGLAVSVAASMFLTGCLGSGAAAVTERDLEVARDMGAPEEVISAMERGEWLYTSDREAVRYAERAIDHMQEKHGQTCHAQWSTVPWVLNHDAEVTLVVDGGEHNGEIVTVTVQSSRPHECTDNWDAIIQAPEYERTISTALEAALVDLPRDSWAAEVFPSREDSESTILSGSLNLYVSPSAIDTEERLSQVCAAMEDAFERTGMAVTYYVLVTAEEPPDGRMTSEFGRAAAVGGSTTELFRAHGNVGY